MLNEEDIKFPLCLQTNRQSIRHEVPRF